MRPPSARYGSSDPSWMRPITERLSPAVRTLVIVDAVLFAFYALVKNARYFFNAHLALGPAALQGELWQLFTSLFVHIEPISFFFNLIGLWFVGATIERSFGSRRFLVLFLGTGLAANAAMLLASAASASPQIFPGSGTAVLGLFVAFGVIYDRTQARVLGGLVLEARALAALLIGFALIADVAQGAWAALVGDLTGVVVAYLLAGGRGRGLKGWVSTRRAQKQRRRYQILEGGRKSPPPRKPTHLN